MSFQVIFHKCAHVRIKMSKVRITEHYQQTCTENCNKNFSVLSYLANDNGKWKKWKKNLTSPSFAWWRHVLNSSKRGHVIPLSIVISKSLVHSGWMFSMHRSTAMRLLLMLDIVLYVNYCRLQFTCMLYCLMQHRTKHVIIRLLYTYLRFGTTRILLSSHL